MTNPLIAHSQFLVAQKVASKFDHERYRIRNKIPPASLKTLLRKSLDK